VVLVDDFLSEKGKQQLAHQTDKQIMMLENTRFYEGEQKNDEGFAKQLAALGKVYVDDAFAVAHRNEASVVGIPKFLPHYAGLLLEKEIKAIGSLLHNPKKPVIAIIGGAKTADKLPLLYKLTELADYLLVGGGIANTFLKTQGIAMGKSLVEGGLEEEVNKILAHAKDKNTHIVLPRDGICAEDTNATETQELPLTNLPETLGSFDIGSETQGIWGNSIAEAGTIIWNGPVGYMENPAFARGTEFIYYSITQNDHAFSVVGGGDTLNAISKREYAEKISHISTGGGAMLEFIEKGTLPGIEALK
jgi:phosphoglycerate kinase